MAFENPFLQPSAVRKSALQYLWSDAPESAIQVTPAPSSSFVADLFGVNAVFPSTAPAATTAPISSEGGDYVPPVPNNTTIGIGKATDARNQKAMIAAFMGLLTGGLVGAVQGGGKEFIKETMKVLNEVNNTDDPLQALNALQGWTDTREPAPVVSGQTNYNTPFSGMLNEESISLEEAPTPAAPQTAFPVTPQVTTPAVATPVTSGTNTVTPLGPQVDPGIQAAIAQAEAQAAAQAQAAADEAAAAQAAAVANSSSGGDSSGGYSAGDGGYGSGTDGYDAGDMGHGDGGYGDGGYGDGGYGGVW
jgi:hypothetical protein